MANNLYIASLEPRSGKSVVALGLMELISRRTRQVGYFRPVIPDVAADNNIQLIRQRYGLEPTHDEMFAFKHDQAQVMSAAGRSDEMLKTIVDRYKALERRCKFVLCEGTDYTGVSSAFEFDTNADIANNLGAPVLIVVNGRGKDAESVATDVRVALEEFESKGCVVSATIVNRVTCCAAEELSARLRDADVPGPGAPPVYCLPEGDSLGKPTVGEVADALGAHFLQGRHFGTHRPVSQFLVAAMKLPNFLERLSPQALVITPGDRADVVMGCLATLVSETCPNVSGLLLTGGMTPEPPIMRLIEGFKGQPVPILTVPDDTFTTAMKVSAVPAGLTPEDDRKIAAALGLFETHVDLDALERRIEVARSTRRTPIMFEYELIQRAKADRRHIVLPEGTEERILRAADILIKRDVCDLTLLGPPEQIRRQADALGLMVDEARLVDPVVSPWLDEFAASYHRLRRHKGISPAMARDTVTDVSYFGTMMVHGGQADGMVSGAAHTTAHTIRPSFEIIKTRPGVSIVSSVFFMCLADRVLTYGDCAVNPNPNARQLADIAVSSAETARMFDIEPLVAMLSYSTGASGVGQDVEKVREAVRLARQRRPDLKIDGPIQYDAAIDASVARTKLPGSEVAGQATVLIFPDLNTGNNTYKAVQRSAGAVAVGPVLQGLNKPVNDLSRGCLVADIVNTVAITAIQAQRIRSWEET